MRHAKRQPPRREIQGALGVLGVFVVVGAIVVYLYLQVGA